MRPITVDGTEPSRNLAIAVAVSVALRPYKRVIGEAVAAALEWQLEHDAAPGGAGDAASPGTVEAITTAMLMAKRNAFISDIPRRVERRPRGRRS